MLRLGANGLLYVSDGKNDSLRVIDQTGIIHAASGRGLWRAWECQFGRLMRDPNLAGRPNTLGLSGLSTAQDGTMFAAQGGGVARINSEVITTVLEKDPACMPNRLCASAVITARPKTRIQLGAVGSVAAADGSGFYFVDRGFSRIRFVNLARTGRTVNGVKIAGLSVGTVAGKGRAGTAGFGKEGPAGQLSGAEPIAVDRAGDLFVGDLVKGRILSMGRDGKVKNLTNSSVAGDSRTCCGHPKALSADRKGNIYILDGNGQIWYLNRGPKPAASNGQLVGPGQAKLVAGGGGLGAGDDGPALEASFPGASAISADRDGNLYVAELSDNTVRRVDSGGMVTTVAGVGQAAFNGDGLKGRLTALSGPSDLAIDPCGDLLISDAGNDRLRRLNIKACKRRFLRR